MIYDQQDIERFKAAAQRIHAAMIEQLKLLEKAADRNNEARARAVSVKAKNLMPGDLVEWGHGMGRKYVNGWTHNTDSVLLSATDGCLWTLDAEQRVRVYR